jgi:hypothetical protein
MSVARHTPRSRSGLLLKWLAAKCRENVLFAVGGGAGTTAAAVIVLHWMQAVGLASGAIVLAALPVGAAVIVAVGCWTLLFWLFWQTRLDPNQPYYTLAVAFSVVMICVSLEAFAGLTTLLWQHGIIRSVTSGEPSLWRAEGHYLWHLLGSVPLISAPRTLGWQDPQPFADHLSGALLLAFKIAIIAPLIRLGLSGFQFFEARRAQVAAKRAKRLEDKWNKEEQKWLRRGEKPPVRRPGLGENLRFLPVLALQLSIAVYVMIVLSDPGFWVNRWLRRLPSEVRVRNYHFPLAWLHAAPPWLLLAALIVVAGNAIPLFLDGMRPDTIRSAPAAAGAILAYFLLLSLLTLVAAATSLALLRVGIAVARPKIPPGIQSQAAVNSYAWAIANGLPGPNIPMTLNWTLQYRFIDRWSDALLLLYKIIFAIVLLFPVYRIIRVYLERFRPQTDPSLSAAREFLGRLLDVRKALHLLEEWRVSARSQEESWPSVYFAARHALDKLESALEDVQSLFGDSDVTRKAVAAEAIARSKYDSSTMISYDGRRRLTSIDTEKPQSTLDSSISEYSWSAYEALHRAADEQLYRTE